MSALQSRAPSIRWKRVAGTLGLMVLTCLLAGIIERLTGYEMELLNGYVNGLLVYHRHLVSEPSCSQAELEARGCA